MHISQSVRAIQVTVTESTSRLAALPPGQVVPAVTLTSGKAGENVDIQLAGRIITIQAEVDLQRGQSIELERVAQTDKLALRVVSAGAVQSIIAENLRPGQTLIAEVVKRLPQQMLLLMLQQPGRSPVPLELDVRQLTADFRPGQQLLLNIISTSPLSVALQTPKQNLAEMIQLQQRRLLPLLSSQPPPLQNLLTLLTDGKTKLPVELAVKQLWQNIGDRQAVQQSATLQHAMQQSGVFMEGQLLQTGSAVEGDFKANLLRLAVALEGQIRQTADGKINAQNLPAEIRSALINLLNQPGALQRLPAHITNVLLANGQTPAQLLTHLLAAQPPASMPLTAETSQQNITISQAVLSQSGVSELARLHLLLREVETAIARVQLNQLTMLREADNPAQQQVWLMDIPVRDKQQLQWMQLQLQKNNATDEAEAEHWQATLNLETQNLGKLRASIALYASSVSVMFTAETAAVVALLDDNIGLLYDKLAALNLQVGQLCCQCAPVEWLMPIKQDAAADVLLDISV